MKNSIDIEAGGDTLLPPNPPSEIFLNHRSLRKENFLRSLWNWLHQWKQNDITNRRLVGQDHHEAVDPDPLAGGRRHPLFQAMDVVLVVRHRLLVPLGARLD